MQDASSKMLRISSYLRWLNRMYEGLLRMQDASSKMLRISSLASCIPMNSHTKNAPLTSKLVDGTFSHANSQ